MASEIDSLKFIKQQDAEIAALIANEEKRQMDSIRLIASENYVSKAVMEATGSVLTNKYSEGYAGKRYYLGQKNIDAIETIAIERAKQLFGAEHANVQPYSGSPANLEVYYALTKPGDTIMGMSLPHGGHLTHGWKVSFSAHYYNAVQYPVCEKTNLIDFDKVAELAREHKPKLIWCGASAYPREIDFTRFAEIAKEINAKLVADIAHIAGLVATGFNQSPFPLADAVTTTTHKSLRGPRGAMIMCTEDIAKKIDKSVFPSLQGGPHNHTTAAMAVAFKEALTPDFKEYGKNVVENAKFLAEELLAKGFGLVTGGTDNHLILIDMTSKNTSGKIMATAMESAGIVCNANSIPFDKRGPFDPSGIRIGTCAATTRGLGVDEMKKLAGWIDIISMNIDNEEILMSIRNEVLEMCAANPIPDSFVNHE